MSKQRVGGSRRAKAQQTRARIIAAAHDEFLDRGYHGATIASIAKRAGVAAQTVYFVFHTKAELLSSAIDDAVMGPDATPPHLTHWWQAMLVAPTARETLTHFVHGVGPLYARAAGISEVLRAAAMDDEECRATWEHHDRLQVDGYCQVIELVASKGGLRSDLNVDLATDVLITVFGDTTYQLLTGERGWSSAQTLDWMTEALCLLLLSPALQ